MLVPYTVPQTHHYQKTKTDFLITMETMGIQKNYRLNSTHVLISRNFIYSEQYVITFFILVKFLENKKKSSHSDGLMDNQRNKVSP